MDADDPQRQRLARAVEGDIARATGRRRTLVNRAAGVAQEPGRCGRSWQLMRAQRAHRPPCPDRDAEPHENRRARRDGEDFRDASVGLD